MATLEELVVQLSADTASLRAEMLSAQKVVQGSTDKMEKAIKDFSENSAKNTNFFQTAMATMSGFLASQAVTGAINVLKDGMRALTNELIEGGQEAIKDEQSFNLLSRSLALNGNYSKEAAQSLADYAEELEAVSGVSGAVISQNLAMISSLTSLDANGIRRVQEAAADMATFLDKDLRSTTEAVTKAINGNEGALGKLGIKLELTTDKAKNLEIVTGALNSRFGGSAMSQINTFGGALNFVTKNYGDMFKEVSKIIVQNEVVVAVMKEVGKIFQQIAKYVSDNASTLRDQFGEALISVIGFLQDATIGLKAFLQILNVGVQLALVPIRNLIDGIQLLHAAATGNFEDLKKNAGDLVDNYKKVGQAFNEIGQENGFDVVIDGLGRVKSGAQSAFDEMVGGQMGAAQEQKNLNTTLDDTNAKLTLQQELAKSFVESLGNRGLDAQYQYENQLLQTKLENDLITEEEFLLAKNQLLLDQQALELQAIEDYENQKNANMELAENARLALDQKYTLERLKLKEQERKREEELNKLRLGGYMTFLDGVASLANSSSKELGAIGKAAAISKATIDAYLAIQNALANVPYPANIAAAVGIGTQAFANVARIAGVGLQGGIDSVPKSAFGGNNGDNFPAVLKPGERVVPSETNQDLTNFLRNQQQGTSVSIQITVLPGTGLNNEQVGNLVEEMNNYFSSGGIKLRSAT